MSDISVEERKATPIAEQAAEFVERKGIGHPDSLIDGIVERVSFELGKAYREHAGFVLHHNVDKGLIIGGTSEVGFGYGKIITPIEVIIAGRATKSYNGKEIDVDNIAISAARNYLKEHTRFLDVDKEVRFYSKILKGSSDLNSIFARSQDIPLANDTSLGIGFAPLTETERLTLETERFLNSAEYKKKMPAVGEDVKVMGIRDGDRIVLTVAIAFVAQLVKSIDEYIAIKEKVANDIRKKASSITSKEVNVVINNGDSHKDKSVYLTKSGLSCESGDDGSVGRGNRVNGLITPFRHMTLEAAAGKNPVNHVGKIYNIFANELAKEIVKEYPQIVECYVSLVSQIGRPINDPKSMYIEAIMEEGAKFDSIKSKVYDLAEDSVSKIKRISESIQQGKHEMF
ncbi:MAG: methionine adenosyltransferase [Candidatus Micrarchaeia archaeon]